MNRGAGLLNYRHFWGSSLVMPKAHVVPIAEVRGALPPETPRIDAAIREQQVRARQRHLAWRFRT
jgi:hypothetical protein